MNQFVKLQAPNGFPVYLPHAGLYSITYDDERDWTLVQDTKSGLSWHVVQRPDHVAEALNEAVESYRRHLLGLPARIPETEVEIVF